MKTESRFRRTSGHRLMTISAATVLLMASQAFAQGQPSQQAADGSTAQQAVQEFRQLDRDQNQKLNGKELDAGLKDLLEQAGIKKEQALQQYDRNQDQALDEAEYLQLVTSVKQGATSEQAQRGGSQDAQVVMESRQPSMTVDTPPPQVQVDQPEPRVSVQQPPADVQVQQPEPQVSVEQPKPKVIVRQPEPEVSVNVPDPQVEVIQPDPAVNVEQAQPQVDVTQPPPEVAVETPEPNVQVEQPEPQISMTPAQPEVRLDQDQPQVEVDEAQAQVDVQQSQQPADVQVTQAEPQVEVQKAEGADVQIQEQEDSAAMRDIESMEAPAAGIPQQDAQVQQAQSADVNALDEMKISELEDQQLVNAEGKEIGDVERVVIGRDMSNLGVIVNVGGVWGIGAEPVLVPVDQIARVGDQLVWENGKSENEIQQARNYDPNNFLSVSPDDFETLRDVKAAANTNPQ